MFDDDGPDQEDEGTPDELEHYLATDCNFNVENPVAWWQEHSHIFPCLSHMAMDYLTVPGAPTGYPTRSFHADHVPAS